MSVFVVSSQPANGATFNGTAGDTTDTLELHNTAGQGLVFTYWYPQGQPTTTYGFGPTTLTSIDIVDYRSDAGTALSASVLFGGTFLDQVGAGLSATAQLIGGAGRDGLVLIANTNAGSNYSFTAPAFSYVNWGTALRAYHPSDRVFVLILGNGDVTLNASAHSGVQHLSTGGGNDVVTGTSGMEYIVYNGGTDTILAGGGDDVIAIANGAPNDGNGNPLPTSTNTGAGSTFNGGTGTDFLFIGGHVDLAATLQSIEGLYLAPAFANTAPNSASQVAASVSTSDAVWAALPANLLLDGIGRIFLNLTNSNGFNGAGYQYDPTAQVELNVFGSDNPNTITGTVRADWLYGNGGSDTLAGGEGNDTLDGGAGSDTIGGGAGIDNAVFLLPFGTTGSLRLVPGGQANVWLVQLVQTDQSSQDVFRVTLTGDGAGTVEGLGIAASLGIDTISGVERLHVLVDHHPNPPPANQFLQITVGVVASTVFDVNNWANVNGTVRDDLINVATLYPGLAAGKNVSVFSAEGNDTIIGHVGANYFEGESGNDALDGGPGGYDTAAYRLAGNTTGTLRAAPGPAANQLYIQLVQADNSFENVLLVTRTGDGAGTAQGLGQLAYLGTDTLVRIDGIRVYADTYPTPPAVELDLNLPFSPFVPPIDANNFAHVSGTQFGETINLASLYPSAPAEADLNASGLEGNDTLVGHAGHNYLEGGPGDDSIDGGGGSNDTAAFALPANTTGTLRTAAGPGANQLYVQLVQTNNSFENVFLITRTGNAAGTVQGLGSMAALGTDTVSNVENLRFFANTYPTPPAVGLDLYLPFALFVPPIDANNFAHVGGTPFGETIDLAAIYPTADAKVQLNANGGRGNDVILGHAGHNFLLGEEGDDTIDGRGGNDTAAFMLPRGTQGSLRVVDGPVANTSIFQLVQADNSYVDAFRVTLTGNGGATVEGLGAYAYFGTDTVTNTEKVNVFVESYPDPVPANQTASVQVSLFVPDIVNNFAYVNGSDGGETIDLAVIYPTADTKVELSANGGRGNDTILGHAGRNVLRGDQGNDTIDGRGGNDAAAFMLALGTQGSLRVVDGPVADTRLVQLVQADNSYVDAFRVILTGNGAATVEGLGIYADFGTDTVTNVEELYFFVESYPDPVPPNQSTSVQLSLFVPEIVNNFAHVNGSDRGETIDLAAIYPTADAKVELNANAGRGNDTILGHAGRNVLRGDQGNDTIDGRDGNDTAAYMLARGTQGSLRVVDGPVADTRLVQLVQADNSYVDAFRVTLTGNGGATVEGLGTYADFGTDTVTNVEEVHFFVDSYPNPVPANQATSVLLSLFVPEIVNNIAHVNGTDRAETIDLAAIYPTADAKVNLNANGGRGNDVILGHAGSNYVDGGPGDDSIDGRGGSNDTAAFALPANTTGTLRTAAGPGANQLYIQLVQANNSFENVFLITRTGNGAGTVQGLGSMAALGTDTVSNVENLRFYANTYPTPPAVGLDLNLPFALFVPPIDANNFAHVGGTLFGETIDIAALYPGVAATAHINAFGSDGNDTFIGGAGDNSFDGERGDDTLNGGPGGFDQGLFRLPANTTGTFRLAAGPAANQVYVQLVQADTSFENVFLFTRTAEFAGTMQGLGSYAYLGTDTLSNIDRASFYVDRYPDPTLPSQSIGFYLGIVVNPLTNGNGSVLGTPFADTIDLSALYPGAAAGNFVSVLGDLGDDVVTGTPANDFVNGGSGDDVLTGLAGDDNFLGASGTDKFDGGSGNDAAQFSLPTGTTGSLVIAPGATPSVYMVSLVNGATSQDVYRVTVTGTGAATVEGLGIAAVDGIDTVTNTERLFFSIGGVAGSSRALGIGLGLFQPSGGAGAILGTIADETLSVAALLPGAAETDKITINGDFGNDTISGHFGPDTVQAGPGNDVVNGLGGLDSLSGGLGNDTIIIDSPIVPQSLIDGGDGYDTIELRPLANPPLAFGYTHPQGLPVSNYFLGQATVTSIERAVFASQPGTIITALVFNGGETLFNGKVVPLPDQVEDGQTLDVVGGAGEDNLVLFALTQLGSSYTFTAPSLIFANWTSAPRAYQAQDAVYVLANGEGNVTVNSVAHAGLYGIGTGSGNDTVNGSDDVELIGTGGGIDTLHGNGGDDTLSLTNYIPTDNNGVVGTASTFTGAGSLFDGGKGTDFMMFGGNVNFQGTLQSIEGVYLAPAFTNTTPNSVSQPATVLTIAGSIWASLPSNLILDGKGSIVVNLSSGQTFDGSGYVFDKGSDVRFTVNGSVDREFIKGTPGADIIAGNQGSDIIDLSAGADFIDGGEGFDYLRYIAFWQLVPVATGPRTYTIGADFIKDSSGAIDTTFKNIERVEIATVNAPAFGDVIDASGFTGAGGVYLDVFGQDDKLIGSAQGDEMSVRGGHVDVTGGGGEDLLQIGLVSSTAEVVTSAMVGGDLVFTSSAGYSQTIRGVEQIWFFAGRESQKKVDGSAATVSLQFFDGTPTDDTYIGGSAADTLSVGGGKNTLTGGLGADTFLLGTLAKFEGEIAMNGDVITDFSAADFISFANVKFNDPVVPTFIGTSAFSGKSSEIRYERSGAQTLVLADVDGDKVADATLTITNGAFNLAETSPGSNILVIAANEPDNGVNDPPIIISNGGGDAAALSISEGQTAVTIVKAADPDASTTLTYSIVTGDDGARFAINSATGALTFKAAPNFEAPTDAGKDNTYVVTVKASDGALSDTQTITVTVGDADEFNVTTPVDKNAGVNTVAENAALGTAVKITVKATDADETNSTVTYSLSDSAGGLFAIDATTGIVTTAAPIDFEATGASKSITVLAKSADGSSASETFAIAITDVDEAPAIVSNGGGDAAALSLAEGQTTVTTVKATDPDAGTALTYSIVAGGDGARFTIDSETGLLAFKTAPDFEAPTDTGKDNTYVVTVRAKDGALSDTQTITVTVSDVGEFEVTTPIDTNAGANTIAENVALGTAVRITAKATVVGAANSTVTYSLSDSAGGLFAIDSATGIVTTAAAIDFEATGANKSITVRAASANGSSASETFTIDITNLNEAPVISSNGGGDAAAISVGEGQTVVTTVQAADQDGSTTLAYSIVAGSDGARFAIDSATGALTFKTAPDFEAPTDSDGDNIYLVTVKASGDGKSDTQTITVTVTDLNLPQTVVLTDSSNTFVAPSNENYTVDGLAGNDKITTKGGSDTVTGGAGNDTIVTGSGDDLITYLGSGNGIDWVDGEQGNDRILALGANTIIGLSSVSSIETISANGFAGVTIAGGTSADTLNFANVKLIGIAQIDGGNGNDTITGSTGADRIVGGAGADQLTGGGGGDTYVYNAATESRANNVDTIFGFNAAVDRIDLSAIDANTKVDGDQAFVFVGSAAFSGKAGELRVDTSVAGATSIQADLDGNKSIDFLLQLDGAIALSAGVFVV